MASTYPDAETMAKAVQEQIYKRIFALAGVETDQELLERIKRLVNAEETALTPAEADLLTRIKDGRGGYLAQPYSPNEIERSAWGKIISRAAMLKRPAEELTTDEAAAVLLCNNQGRPLPVTLAAKLERMTQRRGDR